MSTKSRLLAHCCLAFLLPLAALAGPAADQRIDLISARIQQTPDQQQLYLKRALVYSDKGLGEQALQDVALARTLGPPHNAALVHGIVLYRQGQFGAARGQFDQVLSEQPLHTAALQYRARLLRDEGANEAALADYQLLFRLQPEQDPGLYVTAANLAGHLPEQDIEQGLAILDTRMASIGTIPQLQRAAIALEVERGNHAAAITRLGSLSSRTRATADWHLEMASYLHQLDRHQDARAHLDIAGEQLAASRPGRLRELQQQRLLQLQQAASTRG